jgi:hypothetical protein
MTGNEYQAGMLIPEGFRLRRGDVGISSRALCSAFLEDRDLVLTSGADRFLVSHRLTSAFSETVAAISSDETEIPFDWYHVDRLIRLFQGETVVLGGQFDVSEAIAELKLRGFGAAVGLEEAEGFRLSLDPKFVHECFGDATLRVNGKEIGVSGAGLLLLRQSELTLDQTPALDELISLLRLERVVARDQSELREVARRVGLKWAIEFDCTGAVPPAIPMWPT